MEPDDPIEVIEADDTASVEDFIKELEAKEKDLHITADYQIEIADSDFDDTKEPSLVQQELETAAKSSRPAPLQDRTVKTGVFELQKEVDSLKEKLADMRMERNDIQERSDRRLKDFESYKYRMDRERRGSFINQIGNLAKQMLPVVDNLDRALDSIKDLPAKKRDEFKQFFDGIALVNQQINEVLGGMGVQPIITVGETFDPNLHEAVATDENSDLPPNTVSAEMLRGFRIGNLVVRHSMVRVTATPRSANKSGQEDVKIEPADSDIVAAIAEPTDLPVEVPTADADQA
jgi:molecular chaperone GrpE